MGEGTIVTSVAARPDRVAVIDFEASGMHGYPIEVGLAVWDLGAEAISTWSTLIRPIGCWRDDPDRWWDPVAEGIHGISPRELDAGLHPRDALAAANARVPGGVAHCDGGGFDEQFLRRLVDAAGIAATFRLEGVRELASAVGLAPSVAMRAGGLVDEAGDVAAHRAGPDALRLALAFARASGRDPKVRGMG